MEKSNKSFVGVVGLFIYFVIVDGIYLKLFIILKVIEV